MPDQDTNSLTFKLVYYGPAQSGKTTNLLRLHDILSPELKGEVMTMETKDDRTLFFDLLPLGFRAPSGLLIKLRLFTVPGQVAHDGTRKAVLSRADGNVFVAASGTVPRKGWPVLASSRNSSMERAIKSSSQTPHMVAKVGLAKCFCSTNRS